MRRQLTSIVMSVAVFLMATAENPAPIYKQRSTLFEFLVPDSTSIVMLGNSLTNGCEWHELLGNPKVVNRGISGDTTDDIMERLGCITAGHPAKIFLLAGTNDISHDLPAEEISDKVFSIVDKIKAESPETKIYLQSVPPINNSFGVYRRMVGKEQVIRDLNKILQAECRERAIPYIDLYNLFVDEDGNLKKEFTNDGLHLLGPAYLRWRDALMPYITD